MKQKLLIISGLFSVLLLMTTCYPDGPDIAEEMDIVLSYHNPDYAFGTKTTYAMPDKIVKITGDIVEGEDPTFLPDASANAILSRIEQNMTELGYEKVNVTDNPDLLLLPASWETTTISYWYDYWYWWWGGYYPGWGWGGYYPYYPPVYVTSYTTGTLMMNLMDRTTLGANGDPIIQWSGAINGILTYTYNANRINTAIDKAFDQSPYLKAN
jgi:hypothetical protein